jgi:hypothetical protein
VFRKAALPALLMAMPCFGQDLRPAQPAVEVRWAIVGGVAAGAALLATGRDSEVEARRARQAEQMPCTSRPAC